MKSVRWITVLMAACSTMVWAAMNDGAERVDNAPGAPPAGKEPDKKEEKKDEKKEKEKEFPDFKDVVTEDFKPVAPPPDTTPYYTLYYNEKTDQLLAQIPKAQLGKDLMLSNTMGAGTRFAGWQWDDMIVRWERRDKKLLLLQPEVRNLGKEGKDVSDAVRRTYTDRVLKTVNVKTLSGQDPVVDLGELFKQDFSNIGQVFGGSLDAGLSKWTKFKCFPENIVLTVETPFKAAAATSASDGTLVSVNYNLSSIPETGYKPRRADDRIGYFTTVRRDWGKDYKAKSLFERYVNRWYLEKQDPALAMSPVKNPIIFYIEKTVPVRFRKAVHDGIVEWSKAFEKCGFVDAIQARQQTDYNEFKDYDPEDTRYNFFRWSTTGIGIALGPSRANPNTGQIYDADIVFDDGWIRYPIEAHAVFGPKSMVNPIADPKLAGFLNAHSQFGFESRRQRLVPDYGSETTRPASGMEPNLQLLPDRYTHHLCDYGDDMRQELAFSCSILESQGYSEVPDEFLEQIVKEVVMHEVGHTLGLRHNFKASSWLPLENVLNKSSEIRPFSASVMDYNAFMFNAKKEKQGDYCMRTLGPYDLWAIEYGYKPVEEPYKNEDDLLKAVTDRVAEAGLDYATDEDTGIFEPDPLVNRRDMGTDPLEYAKYRTDLVRQLQQTMVSWAVDDGESYSRLRHRFDRLLAEKVNVAVYAGRYIGGQYFHRDHKGNANARNPFVMVPASKQRDAMKFLTEEVFSQEAYKFDPELLTKLAPGRWWHWESDDFDPWIEYNLHDTLESVMRMALLPVFNPFTLTRIHDMQLMYKTDEEPYTLAEHIRGLTQCIWSELDKPTAKAYTDKDPFIDSVRRGLQRLYTEGLTSAVLSVPGWYLPPDANALVRMNCEGLCDKIAKLGESKNIDDASRAHLVDVQKRLRKALDAQFQQQ